MKYIEAYFNYRSILILIYINTEVNNILSIIFTIELFVSQVYVLNVNTFSDSRDIL
jgi:hypothetical protein